MWMRARMRAEQKRRWGLHTLQLFMLCGQTRSSRSETYVVCAVTLWPQYTNAISSCNFCCALSHLHLLTVYLAVNFSASTYMGPWVILPPQQDSRSQTQDNLGMSWTRLLPWYALRSILASVSEKRPCSNAISSTESPAPWFSQLKQI